MENKHSEGTFILGTYHSAEELNEIETDPKFKNSIVKSILDLRRVNEEFRQEILETKLFKLIKRILDKLLNESKYKTEGDIMFKRRDLKNGMVVEFNDGCRRMYWNDKLIDGCGYVPMQNISSDLYDMDTIDNQHIVKVFLTHDVCYFNDFLRNDSLTCIWHRDECKE